MIKIIMISGKQGSGKTTLATALQNLIKEKNVNCRVLKFAGPLYEMHDAVITIFEKYGIVIPKPFKVLLQYLGTEVGRNSVDKDVWVTCLKNKV